jgi:hypothetical protein
MTIRTVGNIDAYAPKRCAEKTLELASDTFATEMLFTTQEVAPRRTGNLARGIYLRQLGRFEYLIEGTAEYTEAVLYGHRRFWVEPREGGVLHWSSGGQDFFSKGHWIPATEGQDFVSRAQDIEQARLPTYIQEAASTVRGGGSC